MNEEIIQDLKQFITAAVTQQTSDIRDEIQSVRTDIRNLDLKLNTRIDDLSHAVAQAIDSTNESVDGQLQDHEQRIVRLEHKAA